MRCARSMIFPGGFDCRADESDPTGQVMSEPTDEEDLMTREALDDLLRASMPPTAEVSEGNLRRMLDEARVVARSRRAPRGRTMLAVVVSLLFVGGAGVATAAGDWLWIDGLEDPDRSYHYTAPTWGECEIRFSGLDTHNPAIQADVNRIIDEWFATADVEAEARPYVAEHLKVIEAGAAADDSAPDPRVADLNAWGAHDAALQSALYAELESHGYDADGGALEGSESHSQVHCDDEDWGGAK